MNKYFIDYITTDIEGCDCITDDCIISADSPQDALKQLQSTMSYKQRILSIEYFGIITDDDLIELEVRKYMTEEELKAMEQLYDQAVAELEHFREACLSCAYNDEGFCSCYEKKSICCPYADDAEEGD